jgi:hypothetical protein
VVTRQPTPGTKLQPRDLRLLHGLFDVRVLTLPHIAALYFDGNRQAAKKRLQKLKNARYVAERPRRIGQPSILFLAAKGIAELEVRGLLKHYPPLPRVALYRRAQVSELTLRHELDVAAARVALTRALEAAPDFTVERFTTWPLLFQFRARESGTGRERLVKPDGYLTVRQNGEAGLIDHHLFLEIDRSTEPQDTLARRLACYRDHYRSGGFAESVGRSSSQFRLCPFRILVVFRNAERRNNAAQALLGLRPPIRSQVWMTTLDELARDPLGAIFVRPLDYLQVIIGGEFDFKSRRQPRYKRRVARDKYVESEVSKSALFAAAEGRPIDRRL